ncbi:hypothetical protein SDC9_120790 [bioreactor metagenome]|uniref:Uncharacterized protein n=1 Tax=bioreactor metagenome TaxID=1076179 RepID=A0A645CA54_9ZZZZ
MHLQNNIFMEVSANISKTTGTAYGIMSLTANGYPIK